MNIFPYAMIHKKEKNFILSSQGSRNCNHLIIWYIAKNVLQHLFIYEFWNFYFPNMRLSTHFFNGYFVSNDIFFIATKFSFNALFEKISLRCITLLILRVTLEKKDISDFTGDSSVENPNCFACHVFFERYIPIEKHYYCRICWNYFYWYWTTKSWFHIKAFNKMK